MALDRTVTIDQLADLYRKAFDQVCDPTDWRGPINCVVPWRLANLYMQSIEFMTGVAPECIREGDEWARLRCCGYLVGSRVLSRYRGKTQPD